MNLKDKKFLITGILTDKNIAYASAKIAVENGATVVATGFSKLKDYRTSCKKNF